MKLAQQVDDYLAFAPGMLSAGDRTERGQEVFLNV
jgi:hypothetical protein